MITATPMMLIAAPSTSHRSGRKPSPTIPHATDPAMKEAMSKAGVIGAPAISYLDDVESVSY